VCSRTMAMREGRARRLNENHSTGCTYTKTQGLFECHVSRRARRVPAGSLSDVSRYYVYVVYIIYTIVSIYIIFVPIQRRLGISQISENARARILQVFRVYIICIYILCAIMSHVNDECYNII